MTRSSRSQPSLPRPAAVGRAAQQRPLSPGIETIGAGRILLERTRLWPRCDYRWGLTGPAARAADRAREIGISSIAELQFDGGSTTDWRSPTAVRAPLSSLVTATGDSPKASRTSSGDGCAC
jgi:hypothetical protein